MSFLSMPIEKLLSHLGSLGVRIFLSEGRLRVNAPKGALDDALKDCLKQRKGELQAFLERSDTSSEPRQPIPSVPRDANLELSHFQHRLWFLQRLKPEAGTYNLPSALLLNGHLDVVALERAVNDIVVRHEILRTRYPAHEGSPLIRITDPSYFPLEIIEHKVGPGDSAIDHLLETASMRPFDLDQGPLFRACLLRLPDRQHMLITNMHHIVSDGWSVGVMVRELSTLYAAFVSGRPSPLPSLPFQFVDFARWQRKRLQGAVLAEQLAFWRELLSPAPEPLALPIDYPEPDEPDTRGALVCSRIDSALSESLKAVSQQEGGSLFITLLAAVQILLARHAGTRDLVVGVPIAGRSHSDTEGLIGCFINTLAARGDLSGNPTFREFLAQVRQNMLAAYAHQDLPAELLVEELKPERHPNRNPFFDVTFNLINAPDRELTLPGLELGSLTNAEESQAKFHLNFYLKETSDGIELSLIYRTSRFSAARMRELCAQFHHLLTQVVADLDRPIDAYSLLSDTSRSLLADPAVPLTPSHGEASFQPFLRQVLRTPLAAALITADTVWTYAELDEASNKLAHHLMSHGLRPMDRIAIHAVRDASLVISILAIHKVGAAFVILDPAYPTNRLLAILGEAQPSAILSLNGAGMDPQLTAYAGKRPSQIRLPTSRDALLEVLTTVSPEDPGILVDPDQVAYLAFTSGSTGKPKGIIARHAPITRFIPWLVETFGHCAQDRFSMLSGLAHDPLMRDIFTPLSLGAALVIPRQDDIGPGRLARWMTQTGVTVAHLTPSMGRILTESETPKNLQLRTVIFAGEVLHNQDVALFHAFSPETTLINCYGATETQQALSYHKVDPKHMSAGPVPLGMGCEAVQLLILDERKARTSVGEPGEIYFRSPYLALGYLDEQETAARFDINPFSTDPADRLYRTGDLGRYLPDGSVAFAGRNDHQLKIRGFRIETREIEALLDALPEVQQSVVTSSPKADSLVAFLVLRREVPQAGSISFRDHLKAHLPSFMVPTSFTFLDALPLTPNGKLDRAALFDLSAKTSVQGTAQRVAPSNATERLLAQRFVEVLSCESPSIDDDFFELGGHSLLASRLLARVNQDFEVDLPLRTLFEAPTIKLLAERITQSQRGMRNLPPLVRADRRKPLPLSHTQSRMWFLTRWHGPNAAYNMPSIFKLEGSPDIDLLERVLTQTTGRHEILRTRFPERNGEPYLVFDQPGHRVDLIDLTDIGNEEQVTALIERELAKPFDLDKGPLLRTTLIRQAADHHLLMLCMHHIISDGWSMGLLVDELVAGYANGLGGPLTPAKPLPFQFADYAAWQQSWPTEALDKQLAWWSSHLAGAPSLLELPGDRTRQEGLSRGAKADFFLGANLVENLKALGRAHGATPFMVLLAAFKLMLARYSGQTDLVVGTPVANRHQPETETLIGFFANTLAPRTQIVLRDNFIALLERVKNTTLDAFAHADIPFEKLVAELKPERNTSISPIFQVMFALQNLPQTVRTVPGLRLESHVAQRPFSRFDLTLILSESGHGMNAHLEYSCDLFDAPRMERLTHHFIVLLENIVSNPAQPVGELAMIDEGERQALLNDCNRTDEPFTSEQTLHDRFFDWATRTPEATAIIDHDGTEISYAVLAQRSLALTTWLLAQGVTLEQVVGVSMERGPRAVIAFLAIMKAGAAYLPLDPALPRARLRFMIEDTQTQVVLSDANTDTFADMGCRYLALTSDWWARLPMQLEKTSQPVCAGNLANIIYTSGSSGTPKGVAVTHRGIMRLVDRPGYLDVAQGDRVSHMFNLAFDPAAIDIWSSLLHGATLVVIQRELTLDPKALYAFLLRHKLDIITFPTALFQNLINEIPHALSQVRVVSFGGEAAPAAAVARCLASGPPQRLVNLYGPTENSVVSTSYDLTHHDDGVIPIGGPIPNTSAHVVDPFGQVQPVGIPGELWLGGAGLARGYFGRPALTASVFVPDAFSGTPGERFYRSGDRVSRRRDGSLLFLGRTDAQIKMRGLRIEPGEIERHLRDHEGVADARVLVRDVGGEPNLVAYLITEGKQPEKKTLRALLGKHLPAYMIPDLFIPIVAWPLTPNGKLDSQRLPTSDQRDTGQAYTPPRNPIEAQLVAIWQEVLGREKISIDANFFELGGHSLLATRVISQISEVLGRKLPLVDLFAAPTVANLAQKLAESEATSEREHISPRPPEVGIPLSYTQQRLWFVDRLSSGSNAFNINASLRLQGPLDTVVLEQAVGQTVARHEVLRTTFTMVDDEPVGMLQPEPSSYMTFVDLSGDERDHRFLLERFSSMPFDLERRLPWRFLLVRIAPDDHLMLAGMHHIVSDGWSMSLFIDEITASYQALLAGERSPLLPMSVQYADYAHWQRTALAEAMKTQLGYWSEQLGSPPPRLVLPSETDIVERDLPGGAAAGLILDGDLTATLKHLANENGATLFMTLVAVYKVLLGRLSGEHDVAVGTPIAGRAHGQTQRLIGCFLNMLTLRADLSQAKDFPQLLQQVRQRTLAAFAHQDVPFERIVEELNPERDLGRHPIFDAVFNLINVPNASGSLPGVKLLPLEQVEQDAKFMLNLLAREIDGKLYLKLNYRRALFTLSQAERFLAQFESLLRQAVARPDSHPMGWSLITEDVRALWPDPSTPMHEPATIPIAHQIAARAAAVPGRLAVSHAGQYLSYAQLVGKAAGVARLLDQHGLQARDVVAIHGPTTPELPAAMLAVLARAGVLLTLDPNLPEQRRALLCNEAHARFLIDLDGHAPQSLFASRIRLSLDDLITSEDEVLEPHDCGPEDPAYIFFTSGSTGTPKGVLGCHKGLAHCIDWQRNHFDIGPDDRCAQMAGLSFDALLRDIFLPLASGAQLCLPTPAEKHPEHALAWLKNEPITLLHTVPSVLASWLDHPPTDPRLPELRLLFLAGEPLLDNLVGRFRQTLTSDCRLINLYGTTETTMYKTYHEVGQVALSGSQPAGRPIAGSQALVLRPDHGLCGPGEPGRVVLRTPFRTLGYLNGPSGFTPNPFRDDPEDLVYETGDQGHYRGNGELEITGRLDFQLKLRGIRIEPGEIEAALCRFEAIDQAVALAWGEEPQVLVAFLVAQPFEEAALRRFLLDHLPTTLVPSHFVLLEAMPLTANGKADRAALRRFELKQETAASKTYVAPRNEIEAKLVVIWEEVLDQSPIGVTDNFFELGGHSLIATRVASRVTSSLGVTLPLRSFFEAPTPALLAEAVRAASTLDRAAIAASPRREREPLSFAQRRLWFLTRLHGVDHTLNMPTTLKLRGHLDPVALEAAVKLVIERHESLRSSFLEMNGQPFCTVHATPQNPMLAVDLSHLQAAPRNAAVTRLTEQNYHQPFDLEAPSLMRLTLVRLAPDEHLVLLCMHHIISDGWSIGIFAREMGSAYGAFSSSGQPHLPELPIQYVDYTRWQQQASTQAHLDRQLDYWRSHLAEIPPLELPTDRPRSAEPSFRGSSVEGMLCGARLAALAQLAREQDASLFMVLAAAFGSLLGRLAGQDDLTLGTPMAGRHQREVEGLIGLFLNTLVLRMNLAGSISFRQLLAAVREDTLVAFEHQDVPYAQVVEAINPERDPSRNPLFQVFINMLNIPLTPAREGSLLIEPHMSVERDSKFDITLYLRPESDDLRFFLQYNADLFEARRMETVLAQLMGLLEQVSADPDRPMRDHSLITSSCNLPDPTEPLDRHWQGAVHTLFAQRAQQFPELHALVTPHESWSYAACLDVSLRLTNRLRAGGIGPGDYVAIYAARDAALVLSVLATLQSGAAFIILDPAYPSHKLMQIIEAARPKAWLALHNTTPVSEPLATRLASIPFQLALPEATFSSLSESLADWPTVEPGVSVDADHPAFVAFTSGSTGKPKGIVGRHGPLTHFLPWLRAQFQMSETDRFSMLSGLAHDPLQRDMFTPLCLGAALCIPGADDFAPQRLAEWAAEHAISIMQLTPAMSRILAEVSVEVRLDSLRAAIIGGDVLTRRDVSRMRRLAPEVTVVNFYGSTETQRSLGYFRLDAGDPIPQQGSMPLGQGIDGVQLLVLNPSGKLCGIGELGEIHVRSHHLAAGYLGDPHQSAERFLPSPEADGSLLYRTGDLGRYLPDGNVAFAGRTDFQIKLRGFRIEPGEIEGVLCEHPEVDEAIVLLREDNVAGPFLCAWVLSDRLDVSGAPDLLRTWTAERLPAYMVPAAIVVLEHFPVTPNGKLDRRALPDPVRETKATRKPVGAVEAILADIWAEVLGRDQVSPTANFFDMGGHSLLATRVVSAITTQLGVSLSLRAFFEAPTIAEQAQLVEAARREPGEAGPPPLTPRQPETHELPLSYAQSRLWFIDQFQPGLTVYNLPVTLRVNGSFDVDAFQAAINFVIARHESLRTCFPRIGDDPVQRVADQLVVPVAVHDFASFTSEEATRLLEAALREETRLSFDLERGPLIRPTLFRLGENDHVLRFTMHHIVTDGWSMGLLVKEISSCYASFVVDELPVLPELPIQYPDFALWQRSWLQGEKLDHQLAFWRELLADAPVLDLPYDFPRPAMMEYAGDRFMCHLRPELSANLRTMARRQGVTPFMVMLSAFLLLLQRYSGQDDLTVGMPIANRNHAAIENLIGFFVNTLALRQRLAPDGAFSDLLKQVRELSLDAQAHQDVPFESVVDHLRPPRDPSRHPLFSVAIGALEMPRESTQNDSFSLHQMTTHTEVSQFDLNLQIRVVDHGFLLGWSFRTRLWRRASVEAMADHLISILEAVSTQPDVALAQVNLMSDAERAQVLVGWNVAYAQEAPFDDLALQVAAWSERDGDSDALIRYEGDQLVCTSYRVLQRRANFLSQRLRRMGIGREDRVAVVSGHSEAAIVALLGILGAGAVYLPLDPKLPPARLAFMLADSGAAALLYSDQQRLDQVALPTLAIGLDEAEDARPLDLAGYEAAYAIYTSGTTGQPKAAVLSRRNLANLAATQRHALETTRKARVLRFAAPGFDASIWEISLALTAGATLCLPKPHELIGDALSTAMDQLGVTHAILPPTTIADLVPDRLPSLKVLVSGGEACPADLAERWSGACRFFNAYGPTEATVWATLTEVTEPGVPPLGCPLPGSPIYLLDRNMVPVPARVPGQLMIAGLTPGRGYLGRPALTAASWLPNPFGPAGSRLYRSGDLARFRHDGQIEFLGRLDHQVKLRGFRIETGEIEQALLTSERVTRALVLARDEGAQRRLLAYVTGETLDASDLQKQLSKQLPAYMVPSAVMVLDQFPLTANGKVDRTALPDPKHQDRSHTYVAPRTDTEKAVAAIWCELMDLDRVGLHDNFFELGGHSLIATRVASRVTSNLGVTLPLRSFFEATTPALLAKAIRAARTPDEAYSAITATTREEREPLSFAQKRLWFLTRLHGADHTLNIPTTLKLRGHLDPVALDSAVMLVFQRHECLRCSFPELDGQPFCTVHPEPRQPLAAVDLSHLPAAQRDAAVTRLTEQNYLQPFDLESPSLMRLTLVRLAPEEHLILLCMHHIISDGWSMSIFAREMGTAYGAFSAGNPPHMPELPIQYADYTRWQQKEETQDRLDRQLAYWRSNLAEIPPLELPTDRTRSAEPSFRGGSVEGMLSGAHRAALAQLAREQDGSLFMALVAAFGSLLGRLAGQDDLTLGTPMAGRHQREVEGLIGLFLNTLVLRMNLSGSISFRQLLAAVRKDTLAAFEHQDVPYAQVVEAINPERDRTRNPLFQVFINMLNIPLAPALEGSLLIEPHTPVERNSKFDITLYLRPQGDKLHLLLQYNADLFEARRMETMLAQLMGLLEQVTADPDLPLREHSLITPSCKLPDPTQPLDRSWQGAVHTLFAQRAQQIPEAVALVTPTETWSYRACRDVSLRLANRLRGAGVGPGDHVAIYATRDAALVLCVLATLQTGAAFIILDPAYPAPKLMQIIEAAQPKAWLALHGTAPAPDALAACLASIPFRLSLPEARITSLDAFLADWPAVDPGVTVDADSPAYVAFTSGSTGQPKGIVGRHGPLTHFLPWLRAQFQLSETDRFSMLSGLAHDPLQRDMFTPLCLGAALCIPGADDIAPHRLADWAAEHAITIMHLTPAMSRILAEVSDGFRLDALRAAFITGDVLTHRDVTRMRRLAPAVTVVNFYGSTETQRAVGCFRLDAGDPIPQSAAMPLGRGIDGVQLLVLSPAGQLCGIGEVGEIHVRSHHLAAAYLGDPHQSADRFLPSPQADGSRLYRTGDLGRYLPDGNVAFAGRTDFQIKLRGFRIEPGEIEGALCGHPDVDEAVVLLREDTVAGPFLCAWVLSQCLDRSLAQDLLRTWTAERLPAYMVPTAIVVLDRFPVTPNGKLDRRALPEPVRETQASSAPLGAIEAILADIWAEVLGQDQVNSTANFFDLGGHSLLATRVVSAIAVRLGLSLSLRAFFEAPTIAEQALLIEGERRDPGEAGPPPLTPRQPGIPHLPLSYAQSRLWFIDQFQPGLTAYNLPVTLRVNGSFDVDAFQAAINFVIARHESLRTTFPREGDDPVQRVADQMVLPVVVHDFVSLTPEEAEPLLQAALLEEARSSFDLERGPLLRATLFRLGENDHVLRFTMHHIVTDGWSMGLLVREISSCYAAFLTDELPALPELPIQYPDFALWQRSWLQGEKLNHQLAFWHDLLVDAPVLDLPCDFPRPAMVDYAGDRFVTGLSPELSTSLRALARQQGVTPFMALMSAFLVLLQRYSGQDDLTVGMPIANRNHAAIENLIGFFVNTLALRQRLVPDGTFSDLSKQVRELSLDAQAHQDVPFESVVDHLQPPRDPSRHPLFGVTIGALDLPQEPTQTEAFSLSQVATQTEVSQFDLNLQIRATENRFQLAWSYRTHLWRRASIEAMARHLVSILGAVTTNPEVTLARVNLMDDEERSRVLVDWNTAYTPEAPSHDLTLQVAAWAAREGDALISEEPDQLRHTSYRELQRRANFLCQQLRRMGIGREDRVAVLSGHSEAAVVALLAILIAGAVYLPLDPKLPPARLAYMLADSGATALLYSDHQRLEQVSIPTLVIGTDEEDSAPPIPIDGDSAAYTIYTSGTTGKPKAAVLTRRNLANLAATQRHTLETPRQARVLRFAAPGFDASIWEISLAWSAGAALCLPQPHQLLGDALCEAMERMAVTHALLPPTTLADLLPEQLPSLRVMVSGGEACPADLAERWSSGSCRFFNAYGPTEATVWATLVEVGEPGVPPLGRALPGSPVYLLTRHLEAVPARVPGQLMIAGLAPGRGYLGRPALTAASWLPNPFGPAGSRLYRSGDLARFRHDGQIEFLGRLDHQVKLRGFRIETGEIEQVLLASEGVTRALVLARDEGAQRRLLAYVTGEALDADDLQKFLSQRLPAYMVPSAVIVLDQFPSTPNGKVDRAALPDPKHQDRSHSFVAPSSDTEKAVAAIWCELMNLDRVGLNDNFFELGGNSLIATRVIVRLQKQFDMILPLAQIFSEPTLAGLTGIIDALLLANQVSVRDDHQAFEEGRI